MIPPEALRGGVAVVLDVLRATTVMIHALDAGADAIRPCLEIEEARAVAANLPTGTVVLAGERQGLEIDGFDLGNSPGSFTRSVCRGKTVVMTTTNGTRAILASVDADRVLIGSFLNLAATVRVLSKERRPIHLVASGTNGLVSFEDSLLAGALAHSLRATHRPIGNDEAVLAELAWIAAKSESLVDVLGRGTGGRRVREIGLAADIVVAADVDRIDLVAEIVRNPIRVVRSGEQKSG